MHHHLQISKYLPCAFQCWGLASCLRFLRRNFKISTLKNDLTNGMTTTTMNFATICEIERGPNRI